VLVITERTVEAHMKLVFQKLGLPEDRDQGARAAGRPAFAQFGQQAGAFSRHATGGAQQPQANGADGERGGVETDRPPRSGGRRSTGCSGAGFV
jgi:hypothetical protein